MLRKKREILRRYMFVITIICFLAINSTIQAQEIGLHSPNGEIIFSITTNGNGNGSAGGIAYNVSYQNISLIKSSCLRLRLQSGILGKNARVLKKNTTEKISQRYNLITGKTNSVHTSYNALTVELQEINSHLQFTIQVRAYDSGIAFRYKIPKQKGLSKIKLSDERTQFRLADDATAYALQVPTYGKQYETDYIKLPVSAFSNIEGGVNRHTLIGLPLLMHFPGKAWMAITDADLKGYSSTYLTSPTNTWSGRYVLETQLAPQHSNKNIAVKGQLPFQTSWKAIMIANQPGRLIESNLITSLNPPSKLKNTSWIKSGKAAWNWWSGSLNSEGKHAYTTSNMKRYVDFADTSGFRYMLIDAGWAKGNDVTKMNGRVDVPEVVKYAKEKGVKIWVWVPYGQIRNQMEKAFSLFEKWGVTGIKVDFINRDDQKGIKFYYDVAQSAAKHHLMVDYHGSTKPTGIQRTWPNVMGYEAVLGAEHNKKGRRSNPRYQVTLPFTRMLPGLVDYTPGGVDNETRKDFTARNINPEVMGTRAHQLAMYVVYSSPLPMVADNPSAYSGQPSFQFIEDVPVSWDKTIVLNGKPGKYITIARKKGKKWFLGSMTNWTSRDITISLNFLNAGKNYNIVIYRDNAATPKTPKNVDIIKKEVTAQTRLQVHMAKGGGAAIKFIPQ